MHQQHVCRERDHGNTSIHSSYQIGLRTNLTMKVKYPYSIKKLHGERLRKTLEHKNTYLAQGLEEIVMGKWMFYQKQFT